MIDFNRALTTAWERMTVILFQPFDMAKWGLIGFNAFLALLAEGGVTFNNPVGSRQQQFTVNFNSLPDALHAFKGARAWLAALPDDPWFKIYVCLLGAYLIVWLVLNWVGCRGVFVLLDNIVRNRAALAEPWKRYAPQGNTWFLFHTGLVILSYLFTSAGFVGLIAMNWSWINAERYPAGAELGLVVLSLLLSVVLGLLASLVLFLIRTLALPLFFKQTMSLASALVATLTLVFTRPLSILVYTLLSFLLALAGGLFACVVVIAGCCLILCVSCYPIIGSLLISLLLCQAILPYIVFARCFQLGCLEQFGPEYDVFSVDARTLPPGT